MKSRFGARPPAVAIGGALSVVTVAVHASLHQDFRQRKARLGVEVGFYRARETVVRHLIGDMRESG
jgi:hypothetical protein